MVHMNLLDEKDVAERLRVKVGTLRKWRLFRSGPASIKLGARRCGIAKTTSLHGLKLKPR